MNGFSSLGFEAGHAMRSEATGSGFDNNHPRKQTTDETASAEKSPVPQRRVDSNFVVAIISSEQDLAVHLQVRQRATE